MRKVALHGSYFGYNFGDTLLCALFFDWIRSSSPATVVLPLASRRNMELIGADARGLIPFLSCSDLVFCGGGYFGDSGKSSINWSIRNYFRHFLIAELAMLFRKRIYILGTGVGPISSAFLRRRLKRLVGYAECVIVRDDESRDFLERLDVTRKVDVDVDAAMYLERDFFASDGSGSSTSAPRADVHDSRRVAIHLSNFDAPYWDAMAKVVAGFCLREPGIKPLLITDSVTRSGRPAAQDKASQRLKQLIPAATQIGYGADPRELCRLLDTVDLVITNKLHVGIVSVVLGKRVVSLPQHAKTPRFYRQVGLSSICVVDNQAERLDELLDLWLSGELPRATTSARRNIYLDTLRLHLGADN